MGQPCGFLPWMDRRSALVTLLGICGCTSPLFRAQSPDAEPIPRVSEPATGTRLVSDMASPWNTTYLKVEGVGLITQLDGTGSDPSPSSLRDHLIKEMQTRDVKNPAQILASPNTAMVMVRGYIPPAAEKGDTIDVEVRVPPRSETQSLRGGWLMQTRLQELQILEDSLHTGHIFAEAQGPVLVDAILDAAEDKVLETRGRVLSGAIVSRPRQLGLAIREEHASVRTSMLIGTAINERFHRFDRGTKSGVANPTRDNLIELHVHPRYKHNVNRYLRVVASIAVGESASDRIGRIATLQAMLTEPTSAETAALQLEACGEEAAPVLRKGMQSADLEVRFYSAEALAYLDDGEAAATLFEAARNERAFRWRALAALSVLDQLTAENYLVELLNMPSVETRYGAFRALHARNPLDPLVRGELLGKEFVFHVLDTREDPVIHFARSRRPEIVVFGHGLKMDPPAFLFAGKDIIIKGTHENQVRISRFRPGQDVEQVTCTTSVEEIVRAIVQLGGGYADVLRALQSAKQNGYLACRIECDALPQPDREFQRNVAGAGCDDPADSGFHVVHPIPDMFLDRLSRQSEPRPATDGPDLDPPKAKSKPEGFFARWAAWLSE